MRFLCSSSKWHCKSSPCSTRPVTQVCGLIANSVIAGCFSLIDYQGLLILAGLSNAYSSVPPVAGVETEPEQSCGKGKHLVHFLPPCSSGYFFEVEVMLYGLQGAQRNGKPETSRSLWGRLQLPRRLRQMWKPFFGSLFVLRK